MLTSRIAWGDKVTVITRDETEKALSGRPERLNGQDARSLGASLGADYVLFGSVTVIGENVSIDAKMVDVSGASPTLSFFNQCKDMGEVIPFPGMKVDFSRFTLDAKTRWEEMPEDILKGILESAWCARCAGNTTIVDFSARVEKSDLILTGKCTKCGSQVVRLVEGS